MLKYINNLVLKMKPLARMLYCFLAALLCWYFIFKGSMAVIFSFICAWCIFAFLFLISAWLIIFHRKISEIKERAQSDDVSKLLIIIITVISSLASIVTILLLVFSSNIMGRREVLTIVVCFFSIILSWLMVHTALAFHYANLYYHNEKFKQKPGLQFPEDDDPDYVDFAYFSIVIGMTFQVSDVVINDKKMRRLVLLHSVVSFILNTFLVALTVNFIAGLSK